MTAIGQRSGKTYKEVDIGIHEERKKRIRDRINYWQMVKDSAIPGGTVEAKAEKRIQALRRAAAQQKGESAEENEQGEMAG